ncbi:hypothetical protein LshimejAT787_0406780 [Lyophyllum shimeji]|uniref:Uncharacterized protein n=1 Tax=Lyophyllum shimeji TaxID=47721 RepID=A0A9P3PJZ9_LYOSH|nr:hypothetical protein LshimejAT787_0406780 [Lyophyllum shimeji]
MSRDPAISAARGMIRGPEDTWDALRDKFGSPRMKRNAHPSSMTEPDSNFTACVTGRRSGSWQLDGQRRKAGGPTVQSCLESQFITVRLDLMRAKGSRRGHSTRGEARASVAWIATACGIISPLEAKFRAYWLRMNRRVGEQRAISLIIPSSTIGGDHRGGHQKNSETTTAPVFSSSQSDLSLSLDGIGLHSNLNAIRSKWRIIVDKHRQLRTSERSEFMV